MCAQFAIVRFFKKFASNFLQLLQKQNERERVCRNQQEETVRNLEKEKAMVS